MPAVSLGLVRTGRAWEHGHPLGEQPLVAEHLAYLEQLARLGAVAQVGPVIEMTDHPREDGLIAVIVYAVDAQRAREFAARDPAVTGGLVRCEVMPWYLGIDRIGASGRHATMVG